MKKHILSAVLFLSAVATAFASDSNPYIGTANVPNVQLNREKRFFNMTLPEVENMVKNYPLAD